MKPSPVFLGASVKQTHFLYGTIDTGIQEISVATKSVKTKNAAQQSVPNLCYETIGLN